MESCGCQLMSYVLAFLGLVAVLAPGQATVTVETTLNVLATPTPDPRAMTTGIYSSGSLVSTMFDTIQSPTPSPLLYPQCTEQYANTSNSSLPTDQVFEVVLNYMSQFNLTEIDMFLEIFSLALENYCTNNTDNCTSSENMYNNSLEGFQNTSGFLRSYSCSMQQGSQLHLGLVFIYNTSIVTTNVVLNAARMISSNLRTLYNFRVQLPYQTLTSFVTSIMSATTSIATNSTATPSASPGGLTGGQIAGITVGVVAVLAIVVTVIVVAIVVGMVISKKKGSAKVETVPVKAAPKRAPGDTKVLVSHGNKNSGDLAVAEL